MTNYGPRELARQGVAVAHLKIAECIFTTRPVLISTVLGSCISATFYHPETHASAMFHAMLPDRAAERNGAGSCKYVNFSIENIMSRYTKMGVEPACITVKLFGGAFTIQPERKEKVRDVVDVGSKNVLMAKTMLRDFGLNISAEHVLGRSGRKVFFHTATGEVWLKNVKPEDKQDRMEGTPA